MKLIAYTPLLYGLDYLAHAIQSVIEHVDEYWVLYTKDGSYGARTDVPCPESRDILYETTRWAAGDKLRWYDGTWTGEGDHRNTIYKLAPDADVIIALDADEIWHWQTIASVRLTAENGGNAMHSRWWRLPMIHYWRSFRRAVLHDPALPVRVYVPKAENNEVYMHGVKPINHLGYAQRSEIVRYKWLVHGHKNELRKDVDWFKDRWDANAQQDCHPVGSIYWNPEPVNFTEYMPKFMITHPFASLEVIP